MIKKLMMLFVAIMAAMGVWAETETVNGIEWTYEVIDGKASVGVWSRSPAISTTTTGAITIPSTFGGHPVTSIGDYAFSDCGGLTSVTIPSSVTRIGDYAFSFCNSLASIVIPDSVTSIGAWAFHNCYSLTSVTIPDSVIRIGKQAFNGCSIRSVYITDLVKWCAISFDDYGSNPFYYCEEEKESNLYLNGELIEKLVLPDDVTYIGEYAFSGCSLKSVVISTSVTAIGDSAFLGCSSLTNVVISDSLTYISDEAFMNCSSLTNIVIPGSVSYIGHNSFESCHSLTSIVIPDGVTIVEPEAFYNCTSLTNIVIPDSVTSIADGAFRWCRSLTSVVIPENVTYIGKNVFDGCESLRTIIFEGDAPSNVFFLFLKDVDPECVVYVQKDSTGWEVDIPGEWNGVKINYYDQEFPIVINCNVFFDTNGGSVSPETRTVNRGAAVGTLPTSTRSKYKFLGWYTAPEGGTKISATTKVTSDVTYYAQWVYDGSATVSVVVAEGCEAMGKVTGGKTAKAGTKLTLKATANKGYVFMGWYEDEACTKLCSAPGVDYTKVSVKHTVVDYDQTLYAKFKSDELEGGDGVEVLSSYGPFTPGVEVALNLGLVGYTAKKLPSGLKLDKKTGIVKGKAKKPGEYQATFTKKGAETLTAKFIVGPMPTITITMEGDIEKCKVTGASKPGKGYLVGKKVSLSAKGPKGTAFTGWFKDGEPWPNETEYLESKLKYVMTEENLSLVACFEKEKMSVACDGLSTLTVGEEVSIPIAIETQSGVKSVKGSKLPSGLKVKKDKATGEWFVTGKPKKVGAWNSVIKVTAKSGAVEQLPVTVTVEDKGEVVLPSANHYFREPLKNGKGEKYVVSVGISNVEEFLAKKGQSLLYKFCCI